MEKNLQEFIAEEKQENNGIDQQEAQELDQLLHNDKKELHEEAKNILTPGNCSLIARSIKEFLQSDAGKFITPDASKHYLNILNTLGSIYKISNNKDIIDIIEAAKTLLKETYISNDLITSFNKIIGKNGKPINITEEATHMMTNFVAQYNTHNNEKITSRVFSQEDLYKLPTVRKDAFASKLSQIIFRQEEIKGLRRDKGRDQMTQWINNYRQEIFSAWFRNGEKIPALDDQKNIIVWDGKGTTDGILKEEKIPLDDQYNSNIWWYRYESDRSASKNNTIDRKSRQNILDLVVLTDWVDIGWVDITLKIDENTTLKWYTKWVFPDKASRDKYMKMTDNEKKQMFNKLTNEDKQNPTMIIWETPKQAIPEGISLNTWGVTIDAKKFGSKPTLNVDVVSPEGNDETFVTVSTNGRLNEWSWRITEAWGRDISQQNLFENGSHEIKENEWKKLDKTINEIKKIIDENKIAKQGILLVNVESTTDKSPIHPTLHEKLKQDLASLKQSFRTILETKYGKEQWAQKFSAIESSIGGKIKDRNDNDGNKTLVQCRAYEGMQYMVNNLGDKYINKIQFEIQDIQWNQPQRSFNIETVGESIKTP